MTSSEEKDTVRLTPLDTQNKLVLGEPVKISPQSEMREQIRATVTYLEEEENDEA